MVPWEKSFFFKNGKSQNFFTSDLQWILILWEFGIDGYIVILHKTGRLREKIDKGAKIVITDVQLML